MKKVYALLLCLGSSLSFGQNLVPNPSFEEYSSCPDWENQIERATGWNNFGNTPDYFNVCAAIQQFSVPNNALGYQLPRTGNAYAGIVNYEDSTNYKEFIGTQLISPLIVGEKYYISFNIVHAYTTGANCACDGFGVKFSMDGTYNQSNSPTLANNPDVFVDYIVSDSANWTFVTGEFVADSSYEYLILGNFFTDSALNKQSMDVNPWCGLIYYLIDDICVSTDSMNCVSNASVDEFGLQQINIYPNPTSKFLNISSENWPLEIKMYNASGKMVEEKYLMSSEQNQIVIENFNSGVYFIEIRAENLIKYYKITKT